MNKNIADVRVNRISGRIYCSCVISLYFEQEEPYWLIQWASSKTILIICETKSNFLKSFLNLPFYFNSCSKLTTITQYYYSLIVYKTGKDKMPSYNNALTWKIQSVTVSAKINIAKMLALFRVSIFCFLRMFSVMTIIWILCIWKSRKKENFSCIYTNIHNNIKLLQHYL